MGDGNSNLLQDIRSKLDQVSLLLVQNPHTFQPEYPCQLALIMLPLQEAAALSELEERMKSSNHLLAKKEQAISQLQASLAQQVIMWLTLSKETKGCF